MAITTPPAAIFKAYDVRGLYGEEMDAVTAKLIGRAFARVLARLREKEPSELRVGLGRDMRLSAPEMAAAVREGLVAEGATVLDAGRIATEMSYFLVGSRWLDGGAMVTASHNPKAYTGVKLMREGALALCGHTDLARFADRPLAGDWARAAFGGDDASRNRFYAEVGRLLEPGPGACEKLSRACRSEEPEAILAALGPA